MPTRTENIYLDYNATTPVLPEVAAAMQHALCKLYGNPSSSHWAGAPAREAVDAARVQVASLLGCQPSEVVFTSGGTEANNFAIKGVFHANRKCHTRPHLVTSQIEHPAVLRPCAFLEELGAEVTYVPVDRFGQVDPEDVRRAIREETVLVSIMHANNEVGTLQPISEIARIAREHGVLSHTDAAQSVGKIDAKIGALGVDLLSVAGHKLYGPKGVGALIVRNGVSLPPLMHGAEHESARRAGTENVASIVGLGMACQLASEHVHDTTLRDYFWNKLQTAFNAEIVLNGHVHDRLPNTLNVSFLGYYGGDILAQLPHIAASTGSACHAGSTAASPVLSAMGATAEIQRGAIRFSLGHATTTTEIDAVVEDLQLALGSSSGPHCDGAPTLTTTSDACSRPAMTTGREIMSDSMDSIRLTQLAKRAGCAAKQPPGYLLPLLGLLPEFDDPNLLVGSATADDAAVYRISDDLALVLTTDFFTPIVDRPYDFGAIAATNALSDIYAMGAQPLMALNLVGFPDEKLQVEVLAEILRGAGEKAAEAGIAIAGGHTIRSEEPTFGLCVLGTIDPKQLRANSGAQPGDLLVLTKPIGLGIITTAAKNGEDRLGAIDQAIELMTTLNKGACEVFAQFDTHAMTDVTGFGLLGHLRNITSASKVHARVWAEAVPIIPAAREYAMQGIAPGGTHANWRFLEDWVQYEENLSKETQLLLCDAQTSGGLLACVPAEESENLLTALADAGVKEAAIVGQIEQGLPGQISVSSARR